MWLCHNELSSIDDMSSIAKSVNLKEITIENNPISLAGDCVSFLVSYLPMLVSLNQLQITEQVRRAANAWRKSKENTDQNYQHLSSDVSSSIRREEIISNARTNWELIRSQQANIINGSHRQANQIKKSIKSKLISNNSSSSTSTTSSNSSGTNRKSTMSKNLMDAMPNKRQKSKLLRSISHENTGSIISDSEAHLPQMSNQFDEKVLSKKRSASSTRPNVDSESDFVGSDEEEIKSSSRVPTTPPINPTSSEASSPVEIIVMDNENVEVVINEENLSQTPPLPPIEPTVASPPSNSTLTPEIPKSNVEDIQNNESLSRTPTPTKDKSPLTTIETTSSISISTAVKIELDSPARIKTAPQIELKMETSESDKLSTVSKTSNIKTETNVTASANDEQRQVPSTSHTANAYARNKSGVARKVGAPLIRSQTVRNLSSHLNNQTVVAANQQNGVTASGNNAATSKKESKKEIDKDREQGE